MRVVVKQFHCGVSRFLILIYPSQTKTDLSASSSNLCPPLPQLSGIFLVSLGSREIFRNGAQPHHPPRPIRVRGISRDAMLPPLSTRPGGRGKIGIALNLFEEACRIGNLILAQELTRRFGLTQDDLRSDDYLAFVLCATHGHLRILTWIKQHFSLTKTNIALRGHEAFIEACSRGHLEVARWLAWIFNYFPRWNDDGRNSFLDVALGMACENYRLVVSVWLTENFHSSAVPQTAPCRARSRSLLRDNFGVTCHFSTSGAIQFQYPDIAPRIFSERRRPIQPYQPVSSPQPEPTQQRRRPIQPCRSVSSPQPKPTQQRRRLIQPYQPVSSPQPKPTQQRRRLIQPYQPVSSPQPKPSHTPPSKRQMVMKKTSECPEALRASEIEGLLKEIRGCDFVYTDTVQDVGADDKQIKVVFFDIWAHRFMFPVFKDLNELHICGADLFTFKEHSLDKANELIKTLNDYENMSAFTIEKNGSIWFSLCTIVDENRPLKDVLPKSIEVAKEALDYLWRKVSETLGPSELVEAFTREVMDYATVRGGLSRYDGMTKDSWCVFYQEVVKVGPIRCDGFAELSLRRFVLPPNSEIEAGSATSSSLGFRNNIVTRTTWGLLSAWPSTRVLVISVSVMLPSSGEPMKFNARFFRHVTHISEEASQIVDRLIEEGYKSLSVLEVVNNYPESLLSHTLLRLFEFGDVCPVVDERVTETPHCIYGDTNLSPCFTWDLDSSPQF